MAGLELVGVAKKRGDITVADGIDLAVEDGEFVATTVEFGPALSWLAETSGATPVRYLECPIGGGR
jgi:hypothetical protein